MLKNVLLNKLQVFLDTFVGDRVAVDEVQISIDQRQ